MSRLLIATTNAGKRKEILSALLPLEGFEILSLEDLGIMTEVHEHGKSYRENALIKAKAYFELSGKIPTIAEDSGMEVEALQGELGVQTRHWGAGAKARDEEWLSTFMRRMATEKNRKARFVCHAVYVDHHGPRHFTGECLGTITETVEGLILPGIPLSAVFKPFGQNLVYSAMGEEQKNKLSHRGKAIAELKKYLVSEIGGDA